MKFRRIEKYDNLYGLDPVVRFRDLKRRITVRSFINNHFWLVKGFTARLITYNSKTGRFTTYILS